MQAVHRTLLLAVWITASAAAPQQESTIFKTAKTLTALEKCLSNKLSTRGDVTTFNADGMTTVMLRTGNEQPMLIDLAPPSVTVTTRLAYGTRRLIEACL